MASKTPRIKVGRGRPMIAAQPYRTEVFAAIGVIAGLAIVWIAFELGQSRAGHNSREADQTLSAVEVQLRATQKENDSLREKVALLETDAKVDSEAYRQVEAQLADLQAQILKQQEDLAFYRGIVADQERGVRIQDMELVGGLDGSTYNMRLVLAQAMRATRRITGYVEVNVEGTRDGQPVTLDLGDLAAESGGESRMKFSFRYFQNLQASLVLPEGFAPARVRVKLTPSGNAKGAVEKDFDWAAQVG